MENYPIYHLNCGGCYNTISYISRVFSSFNHNTFLKELSVTDSCLNPFDIELLAHMLTTNSTIKVLDISSNFTIGDMGCHCLAACRNLSLNKLIMGFCDIGDIGVDKIGEMLYHNKSITHIDLGQNKISDDGVKRLVGHLNSHELIDFLDLQRNKVTAVGAHHLKRLLINSHLVFNSLELSYNQLKDDGVSVILQSPANTMEYIGLRNTQLTLFNLSCLSKIKYVKLSIPDKCNDTRILSDISTLEQLELCDGSDAAYQTIITNINISRNKSIRLAFCGGCFTHTTILALIQALNQSDNIVDLEITHVKVTHDDCLLLADKLAMNTTVKKMKIIPYYDLFEQSTTLQILNKLNQNYTLEKLTLGVRVSYDRKVEKVVEELNGIRQQHGVASPLLVKLST